MFIKTGKCKVVFGGVEEAQIALIRMAHEAKDVSVDLCYTWWYNGAKPAPTLCLGLQSRSSSRSQGRS